MTHLALELSEIVSHILSYLIESNDEQPRKRMYEHIQPCLLVNTLWHSCATRLMWRSLTFEDSRFEYEAFLRMICTVTNKPVTVDASWTTGLPITNNNSTRRYQSQENNGYYQDHYSIDSIVFHNTNENYFDLMEHMKKNQQPMIEYHQSLYSNALRSLSLRKIKEKSLNTPLLELSQYLNRLEKLDIYICDHLVDVSLKSFIQHNPMLTYLSLAGCNRITDDAIFDVAKHCPQLEYLDLRACGLITDRSIEAIAMNCPNLHHLNVGRVRDREKITIQSIGLIAKKTKVAVLGLAGCDMTDECMIQLAQCRGEGLERISVNNCYRITNKTVQAYVKYCPNLSVFEIKECHWVDDWSAVAELVQRKVLLTLCDQQNRACAEWARRRGRVMVVKPPIK